ncbi:hypothetical protein LCGC14_0937260 [marine sediment metagenome]|uniref:Uncharacterized protein n=1 Tax=marine sediment metagenome TaxID=412755 RepID=A0A0F9R4S8_9ZZZZ
MSCSEKILQLAKKTHEKKWETTALNNIGEILRTHGNYPEALKRYREALQIDEQLGDIGGKAICLSNIATIHYVQGDYPKALKKFE